MLFFSCVFMTGCLATSKDMALLQDNILGLQAQLTDFKKELADVQKQIGGIQGDLLTELNTMQKNQADLSVQIEGLDSNIQMLNSKIEETNEKFLIFGQKLDDTNTDFTNKLSMLSEQFTKKMEETKPSPTQVYGAAYTDYTMKNYDLAVEGFQDYLKDYPDGVLAPNAVYWIGVCYYEKEDYKNAIDNFDKLIDGYQKFEKIPSAKLKKAIALLTENEDSMASAAFSDIVKNHPGTPEARQASGYLSKIKKSQKKTK